MSYQQRLVPVVFAWLCASVCPAFPARSQEKEPEKEKGVLAEPSDAAEVRDQLALLEKLKTTVPDRGAVLYLLSQGKQHLGETLDALALLKEALALREGFDPSGDPEFAGLKGTKEFDDLVEPVHRDFPSVGQARLAFVTEEKDLIPEGLAYDGKQNLFYLGSVLRKKIVEINEQGRVSDFVPGDRYGLLSLLGIRMDPTDGTVWADTFDHAGRTELVHLDATGKLLERFAPKDQGRHEFNDLVVRKNGEVITTDTFDNRVFRFQRSTQQFAPLPVHRALISPNGIALSEDDHTLYVADAVGIVKLALEGGESHDRRWPVWTACTGITDT